jgi:hypothetical protein
LLEVVRVSVCSSRGVSAQLGGIPDDGRRSG